MSLTYLLMDDDLKEAVLITQDPLEIIAKGLDRFSQTKHDLSVAKFDTKNSHLLSNKNSRLLSNQSFEDFVIDWEKSKHEK
jgi:hypothetical protein